MKIILILVGKTVDSNLKSLLENYASRIAHYVPFEIKIVPEPRTPQVLQTKSCVLLKETR